MNSGAQVESIKPRYRNDEIVVREIDRERALFRFANDSEYIGLLAIGRAIGTPYDDQTGIDFEDRAVQIRRVGLNVSQCSLTIGAWSRKQPHPDRCSDYG